jgi:TM2 domain-containing membrane protein YozV
VCEVHEYGSLAIPTTFMNFFLFKNDQKMGPYSAEQIRIFLGQGLVMTTDQVWADGWTAWMPIGQVPGLAPAQESAQTSQPPTTVHSTTTGYTPPSLHPHITGPLAEGKSPFIACLLSLVIVGTGQFYNGDWVKGWFMLITCILASIFSAGAMWLFWALFSAFDAYRVASRQKPLGQYYPL